MVMTNHSPTPSSPAQAKKSISPTKRTKQVPLELRFLISETCGLIVFVETISGRPHNTDWLRDWYFQQRGAKAEVDRKICQEYSKFLDRSGEKYEASDVSGRRMTLSQRILCMTAECETLDGLLNKLEEILLPEDYNVVEKTYRYFSFFTEGASGNHATRDLLRSLRSFGVVPKIAIWFKSLSKCKSS